MAGDVFAVGVFVGMRVRLGIGSSTSLPVPSLSLFGIGVPRGLGAMNFGKGVTVARKAAF